MEKVVHCRRSPYDVYIGRPSKWGNPFTHIKNKNTLAEFQVNTRAEAISRYEEWLRKSPLLEEIEELRDKVLGCWCKPQACHGDIIIKLLQEKSQNKLV